MMWMAGISASATVYSGDCGAQGDNVRWSLDTETYVLTISGEGDMADYTADLSSIPWDHYYYFIESVRIDEGVTSIGEGAFYCTPFLESIRIPGSVASIGYLAFYSCSSVTSIVVDSSNKVFDSRDDCNAIIETATGRLIIGCNNTVIPNSVTSIGQEAFCNCHNLASIDIPNSVVSIGNAAFLGSGLTSISIPESVTSIGSSAFATCKELKTVGLPHSLTNLGHMAFLGCTSLTSISIPESVTSIDDAVFSGCSSLTSITIPESVTSIGIAAFEGCSGLTSISIPESVTSIGYNIFQNCTGLTSITVNWQYPLTAMPLTLAGIDLSTCVLYVPEGTSALYMEAPFWQDFENIREFGTSDIDTPRSSSVRVSALSGTIVISGANENDKVAVYSVSGTLVKTARGNGRISLDAKGVYIIKAGTRTFKVRM